MPTQYSINEFADMLRNKYPDHAAMPTGQLVGTFLNRHPEFRGQVKMPQAGGPQTKDTGASQDLMSYTGLGVPNLSGPNSLLQGGIDVVKALPGIVHPIKSVVDPMQAEAAKARSTTGVESFGHAVASGLPIIGPLVAQMGEELGTGKGQRAIGQGVATALVGKATDAVVGKAVEHYKPLEKPKAYVMLEKALRPNDPKMRTVIQNNKATVDVPRLAGDKVSEGATKSIATSARDLKLDLTSKKDALPNTVVASNAAKTRLWNWFEQSSQGIAKKPLIKIDVAKDPVVTQAVDTLVRERGKNVSATHGTDLQVMQAKLKAGQPLSVDELRIAQDAMDNHVNYNRLPDASPVAKTMHAAREVLRQRIVDTVDSGLVNGQTANLLRTYGHVSEVFNDAADRLVKLHGDKALPFLKQISGGTAYQTAMASMGGRFGMLHGIIAGFRFLTGKDDVSPMLARAWSGLKDEQSGLRPPQARPPVQAQLGAGAPQPPPVAPQPPTAPPPPPGGAAAASSIPPGTPPGAGAVGAPPQASSTPAPQPQIASSTVQPTQSPTVTPELQATWNKIAAEMHDEQTKFDDILANEGREAATKWLREYRASKKSTTNAPLTHAASATVEPTAAVTPGEAEFKQAAGIAFQKAEWTKRGKPSSLVNKARLMIQKGQVPPEYEAVVRQARDELTKRREGGVPAEGVTATEAKAVRERDARVEGNKTIAKQQKESTRPTDEGVMFKDEASKMAAYETAKADITERFHKAYADNPKLSKAEVDAFIKEASDLKKKFGIQ